MSDEPQACPGRYPEWGEPPDHDWEQVTDWDGEVDSGRAVKITYRICRLCGEEDSCTMGIWPTGGFK